MYVHGPPVTGKTSIVRDAFAKRTRRRGGVVRDGTRAEIVV